MKPKPKVKISKHTKLEKIMFDRGISKKALHEKTGIAYPTLFNILKGRKTNVDDFRKRTLRDLELFLGVPPEKFIGWEGEQNGKKQK